MVQGINRTGTPDPAFYNLGRGGLFFALLGASGEPLGYKHLGNATAFNVQLQSESIKHQSSRSGVKVTDLEILVSQDAGLSLTLQELDFDNIAYFLSGESADVNSTVATANGAKSTSTDVKIQDAANKARWYDLKTSGGVRLYDIVTANLTVKTEHASVPNTAGATLALNTDYTVDLKMGRIFILSTSSGHTNGKDLYFTYTADATAKDIDQVRGLTKTAIVGALKFIGINPANSDKQIEVQFHKVTLKAEGDLGFIGDDYTEMTLTGSAGKNEAWSPASPVVTITTHADA